MMKCCVFSFCLLGWLALPLPAIEPDQVLELWPNEPPGQTTDGEERDTTGPDGRKIAGRPVVRLGFVSRPTISVYQPPAEQRNGAAVMVCPGGGYHILAYDLEGTEVCEWLNSIGVTAVLLKYRVPRANRDTPPIEPLQDVQRAMSLTRHHAADWGIDPQRLGVLGFSAGGHLAARVSTNYKQRAYDEVDQVDRLSCRPDFAVLVYPGYLVTNRGKGDLATDVAVDAKTPPMFMTMAFDDGVGPENVLRYGLELKRHEVPVEIHLYPSGGHGYGLRRTDQPATTWPDRCRDWLQHGGWLAGER